ncbi:MAG: arylsulfatase [Verrucomicrobiota bacterium]
MKLTLFVFSIALACFCGSSLEARQPNVVVILTDDQGWGDLSANGNTNLETPRIDSLAAEGLRMENFYVCPVCAPTRAEFLTGRYYSRTGVSGVSTGQERLNTDETTIADVFQNNGYATGAFGKWHNGTQSPYHPLDRGFDEYYGFTSGHWGHYFSPLIDDNGMIVRGEGFVVDDFTNRAIDFIERNKDAPFFCYIPLNTPHSPMMVPDRFYEKFKDFEPGMTYREPKREDLLMTRAALALCENIDWNVGRLLDRIDALGLRENTIVIFFCDNGPNSARWNGGMKGRKGSADEGGVRSPFFLRWPDRIQKGVTIWEIGGAFDLMPSLAEACGLELETNYGLDGRSLLPLWEGGELAWNDRSIYTVRRGEVSVRTQKFRLDVTGALFDIENDRGQRKDVSQALLEVTARLREEALAFRKEVREDFEKYSERPYTIGFGHNSTLPARDGVPHGNIIRSSKAPNNSFFKNWTDLGDSITWEIEVAEAGDYEARLWYKCAEGNEGVRLRLGPDGGDSVVAKVVEVFDPPLYAKPKERVLKSHYFVKDFVELEMGSVALEKGRALLRLSATELVGNGAVDVHSVVLKKVD